MLRVKWLPQRRMMSYITSPIFYVNAAPHIGHVYTAVLCDVLHRHEQLVNPQEKHMFSIGTDEHGLKIQQAAALQKQAPEAWCKTVSSQFQDMFALADISYTDYIRTTENRHCLAVEHLWKHLYDEGYIYKGHHEGWYSISDECFYPESQVEQQERQVIQNGTSIVQQVMVSKETNSIVEWTKEENYKFKLSLFKEPLKKWLEENPEVILPKSNYNLVYSWLSDKSEHVKDISVSRLRSKLTWGIPVPNDPTEHTIYVWLDALTNYLTVAGYPHKTVCWPPSWQVVGKDIIKFHAIYWPAFLMAAGLPLPKKILSHAHWLKDNTKMSKSVGNVVDPRYYIEKLGSDAVRYFLVRDGGLANDADFSESVLMSRYNHDLRNQLGNLFSRSIAPTINPRGSIPGGPHIEDSKASSLCQMLNTIADSYKDKIEMADFSGALGDIAELISEANTYWQQSKPWELAALIRKTPNEQAQKQLDTILYHTYEALRISAILLLPTMPNKMKSILDALNVQDRTWSGAQKTSRKERTLSPLPAGFSLFPPVKLQ